MLNSAIDSPIHHDDSTNTKSECRAYGQRIARYVGDVLAEEVGVGVVVDHRALDGLEGRAEQVVVVVVACGHRASQVSSGLSCQEGTFRD